MVRSTPARRAAEAVADGRPIPPRLLEMTSGEDRSIVEQLHVIGEARRRRSIDTPSCGAVPPREQAPVSLRPAGPRQVAHRTVSWLLGRAGLDATIIGALALLAWVAWLRRHEPLVLLLEGRAAVLLASLTSVALVLRVLRERLPRMTGQQRRHALLDAGRLLETASREMNQAVDRDGVAAALLGSIDRALDPTQRAVHLRSRSGSSFDAVAGTNASLRSDSGIAAVLQEGTELNAAARTARSIVGLLPPADRVWFLESGYTALVPLLDPTGELLGFVGLGGRSSGMDYDAEDIQLTRTLCGTAAVALARFPSSLGPEALAEEELARICEACGRVAGGHSGAPCRCGVASQSARLPQHLLGKFTLVRRLGAGAMGVVYEADDTRLHRRVAIKTLPSLTPRLARHLLSEGAAMAAVSHPHIAVVHGVEVWHGLPFLVMELLVRGSLADRLDRGPLPLPEVRRLGLALGAALECLHRAGYLHRDVKPSNIGFDRESSPKLLDLSLAQVADAAGTTPAVGLAMGAAELSRLGKPLSGERLLMGTPLYLPPEALAGTFHPSPAVDLWGLAVVLYEALTGEHPFWRHGLQLSLAAVARAEFLPPTAEVDFDPVLLERLRTALDPNPARRPPTAEALLEHLGLD